MIYVLKRVLSEEDCASFLDYMRTAEFVDGRDTAGSMGRRFKKNRQTGPSERNRVESARLAQLLLANEKVRAVAIPRSVSQPLFNAYGPGDHYGAHYDNAAQQSLTGEFLRADLSGTLLLNAPGEFEGGELSIRLHNSVERVALEQGDLVMYQSGLLHEVSPVKHGERLASVFWVQSMIADASSRQLVIDYDLMAQRLLQSETIDPKQKIKLTGVYHRMIKQFSR